MKKQIFNLILLVSAFIFTSGSVLVAQPDPASHERKMPGKEFMREKLNLSQDQKDKIKSMRLDNEKKLIDVRAGIEKLKLELREMTESRKIDENKVLDITKKISSLQADMKEIHVKTWLKTYNLLDDKQKETYLKITPILKEKMQEMKKNIRKKIEIRRER